MAVMSAIVGVRPPPRRLRQPHPGTARRRLARSALPQSAGHLQPASAQTQRPHRSAIGTAPLPTHTTGQTRRLVHQHLRTAQGPGLAALDPRLPPELVRRSPLAVAWRQFDRALDNFINEAPPPHHPQLGLVVTFTPTKRSWRKGLRIPVRLRGGSRRRRRCRYILGAIFLPKMTGLEAGDVVLTVTADSAW